MATKWRRRVVKCKRGFHDVCIRAYFFLTNRLQEASTLRGIVAGIAGFASFIKPDKVEAIVSIALLVIGAIGAITPDSWRKEKAKLDVQSAKAIEVAEANKGNEKC